MQLGHLPLPHRLREAGRTPLFLCVFEYTEVGAAGRYPHCGSVFLQTTQRLLFFLLLPLRRPGRILLRVVRTCRYEASPSKSHWNLWRRPVPSTAPVGAEVTRVLGGDHRYLPRTAPMTTYLSVVVTTAPTARRDVTACGWSALPARQGTAYGWPSAAQYTKRSLMLITLRLLHTLQFPII